MKTTMLVIVDKHGKLVAACPKPSPTARGPVARIAPASPEHALHELQVPAELLRLQTFKELHAAIQPFLPRAGKGANKARRDRADHRRNSGRAVGPASRPGRRALTLAATRARGIGRNRVAGFGRRMVVQV